MLPTKEISRVVLERFASHESGDPIRVANAYADDAEYWDTACPERLKGREAVSRHLRGFLERFDVRFSILEEHRLEGRDAAMVMWHCAARRRLPGKQASADLVMQRGMSLIEVRDGLVTRDEAYMDLASLQPLLADPTA